MKKYYISELYMLACIGPLLLSTNAWYYDRTTAKPTKICLDNSNADAFIQGDSINGVQNFMDVIRDLGFFSLLGDAATPAGTTRRCRHAIANNKRSKGRFYDGIQWSMGCWEPSECTVIQDVSGGLDILNVLPVSTPTNAGQRVRTVILPLDMHNTCSYTFLPSTTQKNIFFVTSMLSGCSIFVAKPNDVTNCNLIVIHTNYLCNDKSATGIDYNHKQAMAVLGEVQSTSHLCRYLIERRWAEIDWRPAVEAARHDYANRTFFYNADFGGSFLYASYVSRNNRRWQFCIKAAIPNAPPPECYFI